MGLRGLRGKDKKSTGWMRDTVLRIYTADMLQEDWNAVTPADRLKIAASWVPKELKVDSNTTISLVINGVRQAAAIDGTIHKALTEHVQEDDEPE